MRPGSGHSSCGQPLKRFAKDGEWKNGTETRRMNGVKEGLSLILFFRQEVLEYIFGSSCVCPRQRRDVWDAGEISV